MHLVHGAEDLQHAFLWTVESGLEDLGTLGGLESGGSAVNGDGSIVGGWASSGSGVKGFVWTRSRGMIGANEYLVACGADTTGWTLGEVTGLSLDGTVLMGQGVFNGENRTWVVYGAVGVPHER
jgi:uncharacterized membrane protein